MPISEELVEEFGKTLKEFTKILKGLHNEYYFHRKVLALIIGLQVVTVITGIITVALLLQ